MKERCDKLLECFIEILSIAATPLVKQEVLNKMIFKRSYDNLKIVTLKNWTLGYDRKN